MARSHTTAAFAAAALLSAVLVLLLPSSAVAATPGPLGTVRDAAVTFSGSGFLGVFHLGALQQLQALGLDLSDGASGTSGGSLVSGLWCLGVPDNAATRLYAWVDDTCKSSWSCAGKLDKVVKQAMQQAVTDAMTAAASSSSKQPSLNPNNQADRDAFVRQRCANKARFTVSKIARPTQLRHSEALKDATPVYVTDFTGEADFVDAASASSFIPLFSGREAGLPAGQTWHTLFRGFAAADGGFSAPLPPCAPGAALCVKVVATTDDKGKSGASMLGSGKAGFALDSADIAPGKYSALPMGLTRDEWQMHALAAPGDALAAAMQQHGRDQALGWACQAFPKLMAGQQQGCAKFVGGGGGVQAPLQQQQQAQQAQQPAMLPRRMMMPPALQQLVAAAVQPTQQRVG